jgi:predicted phosphate transport protein (TIGR00153 family)
VHAGAVSLKAFFDGFGGEDARRHSSDIRGIERRGDELERTIIDRLNKVFLTPLDREDIHAICNKLESILDILEGVANRAELYAIAALTPEVLAMADGLTAETAALADVVGALESLKPAKVSEAAQRLKALEAEMDRRYREGVARLFTSPEFPPLEVLKLKEILERLEEASDHCEDVTDLVEGIIIKHV